MKEVWKDIAGYEGLYQVSNLGRVKSAKGIKTPLVKEKGYLALQLYKNNKPKNYYVHRLVAKAFLENPENKETVNHINGNKQDNRAENLEWCSYKENNNHAYENGLNDAAHRQNRKGSFPVAQYDLYMNLLAVYPSMREAERQTGVNCTAIGHSIRKGWKSGGFIWKRSI